MNAETIALIKAFGGGGSGSGGSGVQRVHFTWNDDYSQIVSADKTVTEIVEKYMAGEENLEAYFWGIFTLSFAAPAEDNMEARACFIMVRPDIIFGSSGVAIASDLYACIIVGIAKSDGDVWSLYNIPIIDYGQKSLILKSSTAGSTKKFGIKVDDSGTITATEVTG